MNKHFVITIGREFGSGGRAVAEELAKRCNVSLYDKELLAAAAKDSGLCQEIFEHQDEKPTGSFLYSLVMDTYSFNGGYSTAPFLDMPLNHRIFLAQFETIKKIAEHESCVIIGRCADYALAERNDVLNVFIHADEAFKIKNTMKNLDLTSESKAKDINQKNDKQRASYYNYYTSKKWGDSRSYDLTLDSSKIGIDGCVDMILKMKDLYLGS